VTPTLQAILVADHVYRDATTGEHIIAGVFHGLVVISAEQVQEQLRQQSPEQPTIAGGMQAGSPCAYISLTNMRNNPDFSLRYVSLKEDLVLFHTSFSVPCDDPLQVVELIAPLPSLPTKKPGVFALELLWRDVPLGSFKVSVIRPGGSEDDTNRND